MWVRPAYVPVEVPGLVLLWDRTPDGWRALVTWIEQGGRVATDWVAVADLRPIPSRPSTGSRYDG